MYRKVSGKPMQAVLLRFSPRSVHLGVFLGPLSRGAGRQVALRVRRLPCEGAEPRSRPQVPPGKHWLGGVEMRDNAVGATNAAAKA
mmetsp:Transcript_129352/g.360264  ORF Transcript_129352/g.360264 Transcript_129352/m.360264 type:complete len:86 (-) Transcript_129352:867-1124(-)